MSSSADATTPLSRRLLADGLWALGLAIVSVAYFLVTIAVGTSFFGSSIGPAVTAATVWGTVAIFALQAVPILWRSRFPVLSFILVYACFIAAIAVSVDRNLTVTITLLFAVFSLTSLTGWRTWTPVLGLAVALDLIIHLVLAAVASGGLSALIVLAIVSRVIPTYVAPVLAGLLYGSQRRRATLASDYSVALRQARDSQLAVAVASERNRMARELHDVSAHHISGIILQTKAAIRVRESDPATTVELLESIRVEGELTLQSMREVIGVLREDDDEATVAGPTLSRLPDLMASVRTLHPSIDLSVSGDIDDLSPTTSLACFRIIQESLTNARKHAPGSQVAIRLRRTSRELMVEVSNTPVESVPRQPEGRTGYGVLGMRERATMLGGTLRSDRTPDGGWKTHAIIPLERWALA
ncbi:sensor histidine kinase [Luethyella okanaganae]|uniref:histidine kinase n=1 Tax=Luethyella okanaganae TaxID=69372 RepID=A0ABW1VGV1_9MICO